MATVMLGGTSASANNAHVFSSSFGSAGSQAGGLASPGGVAVNAATHDLYVADTGNARIDQFDSAGGFIRAWGWGVADGLPMFETCTLNCQAGVSGAGAGQFETPRFIAVDNSAGPSAGDVYVGDTGSALVQKFTAAGELLASWGDGSPANGQLAGESAPGGVFGNAFGSSLGGIAIDTSGNLWALTTSARVVEFDQGGAFIQEWPSEGARQVGIAVAGDGSVYLANGFEEIEKFASNGGLVGRVTPTPNAGEGIARPTGLAVDQAAGTGDLYVDLGASVEHFPSSCAPASGFCAASETFGSAQLSGGAGLAVDSSNATVYAADAAAGRIYGYRTALVVETGGASGVQAGAVTVSGVVNPEGAPVGECEFEYGTSTEYDHSAPCEEAVGSGTGEVTVHAHLEGLQGGSVYHYRLLAGNAAVGTLSGEDQEVLTSSVAVIDSASAVNVTTGSALLRASINPRGLDTTYHFEWGTSGAYGNSVPIPDRDIGAGEVDVPVSAQLVGLSAGVTYHWRVVAHDVNGTSSSPDKTFVYDVGGGGLPDGRRYEMVTPAQKNGALIDLHLFGGLKPQISEDGLQVLAPSLQCFAGAQSCIGSRQTNGEIYAFARTGSGWVAHPLALPASSFETSTRWAVNGNTGNVLLSAPGPPLGGDVFYARQADGTISALGPIGEGHSNFEALGGREGLMATADLSHLVYETNTPQWSFDAGTGAGALYEYVGVNNTRPILVGVSGGPGSTDLIGRCGTGLGSGTKGFYNFYGALSEDGRTVYFTVDACGSGSGANENVSVPTRELYARIDGGEADAHTVAISRPAAISPAPPDMACETAACIANTTVEANFRDAAFEGASADGSRTLFTDTQQLTDSAVEDPLVSDSASRGCVNTKSESSGCNLYESICAGHCVHPGEERQLIDVSAAVRGGGARVQGMMAASPDCSHVYFVAKGVLSEAPNSLGQVAHRGVENMYVYERDTAYPQGRLAFIATLSPADHSEWEGTATGTGVANVTPDGRSVVFTSHRALTVDDTRPEGPQQVFDYDARSGALIRISVGENGFNDNGNAGTGNASIVKLGSASLETGSLPQRSDPTMSHDGAYVFFESPVGLTPGALDDVRTEEGALAENVYEYHEGHVYLISDGKDVGDEGFGAEGVTTGGAELLGSDATGANVFFATIDQLSPDDTDTERDLYDAHVCSASLPCLTPVSQPKPCEGEACHEAPAAPPAAPVAGSVTFSGTGNATPVPARAVKGRAKPLTRAQKAQKLAKALRACRREPKRKRASCQKKVRQAKSHRGGK